MDLKTREAGTGEDTHYSPVVLGYAGLPLHEISERMYA
jgi:hypothetical protein